MVMEAATKYDTNAIKGCVDTEVLFVHRIRWRSCRRRECLKEQTSLSGMLKSSLKGSD
jgi:hypothetical protein